MKTICIDWGTSNTRAAFHDGLAAAMIPMADGTSSMPSVLAFDDNDLPIVGWPAVNIGKVTPMKCFTAIKRIIGDTWIEAENTGGHTVQGADGKTWLKGPDKNYPPEKFAAVQIDAVLDAAEAKFSGDRPESVVMTVPASYNEIQRSLIRKAAVLAGIAEENVHTLDEPIAAAIANGADRNKYFIGLVYDWGGGTLDVTVIKGGNGRIEVLGTRGNSRLGGKDIDETVVREVLKRWLARYQVDLGVRTEAMARIRMASEKCKIDLTTMAKSHVEVPMVDSRDPTAVRSMNEPITIDELEAMALRLVDKTFEPVTELLADLNLTTAKIDDVFLVGGMTRMPLVQRKVTEYFGKKPSMRVAPEDAVALGGATYAAAEIDKRGGMAEIDIVNRATHSLYVETLNNVSYLVIPRGAELPAERFVKLTTNKDDQPVVGVHILEGNAPDADKNVLLARDYPPVPPGLAGGAEQTVEIRIRREKDGSVNVFHGTRAIYSNVSGP